MLIAPLPFDESERQEDLESYSIIDTPFEDDFDGITKLASQFCNAPVSLITLIDKNRQWFKARVGIEIETTSRDIAFCAHAILQDDVMVVEDANQDERFRGNPIVTDMGLQFYAGKPIFSPNGYKVGTICVMDNTPRRLSEREKIALVELSKMVTRLLEIKQKNLWIRKKAEEFILLKSQAIQSYISRTEIAKEKLARMLHENAAQNIASALLLLQLETEKSGGASSIVGEVKGLLSQTLREIKKEAFKMTPLIMADIDSSDMIVDYLNQLAPTYPFVMNVEADISSVVADNQVLLFSIRIIEQWLNVLSYKKGVSEVNIRLYVKDRIIVEMEDACLDTNLIEREKDLSKNILLDKFHAAGGEVRISNPEQQHWVLKLSAPLTNVFEAAS